MCRLTLIGEELVKGRITFVEAMRLQLKRYQYPSAAVWSGSGSVNHSFRVHPFQFLFRLLRDPRLQNSITMKEMYGIVIHKAYSDSPETFEEVVSRILLFRQNITDGFVNDTPTKTYSNIANTFFNYISLTQYTDRGREKLSIRQGKEALVDAFIESNPSFIPHPDISENYQRTYGRGNAAMDRRNFNRENTPSQNELNVARIQHEYVLLALKTPITGITPDIVDHICNITGIDERTVERILIQNYSHDNIDDFFIKYKEYAHMGRAGARAFEVATCEVFRKLFHMKAKHVGPIGNTPDVFIESEELGYCGIIDNKAYKNGYSITGNHRRVMEDVYIPTYRNYGQTDAPLAFFTYIADSFGRNINSQINEIVQDTGVAGSAMPVDIFIDMVQNYAEDRSNHLFLRNVFSVNREVCLADINLNEHHNYQYENHEDGFMLAAESEANYGEYGNRTN